METHYPLIAIVGPTASGKTSLAITLAKRFGGEIICADSRTVYKDMNIGTAKPTTEEQQTVPHWGLDLIEPGERFTASNFKTYALAKIQEIRRRGHIPFLVGGTGLYIDAVLFDYQFGTPANEALRAELGGLSTKELHDYCAKHNIKLPENSKNKRYLIRAIEQNKQPVKRRNEPISESFIVGIATDKDELRMRIADRTEHLFENGVVEEAMELSKKYGWNNEAMTGNVYPVVKSYLENEISMNEMKDKFTTRDCRLAKRQITWLKRNSFIQWHSLEAAEHYVSHLLVKLQTS